MHPSETDERHGEHVAAWANSIDPEPPATVGEDVPRRIVVDLHPGMVDRQVPAAFDDLPHERARLTQWFTNHFRWTPTTSGRGWRTAGSPTEPNGEPEYHDGTNQVISSGARLMPSHQLQGR